MTDRRATLLILTVMALSLAACWLGGGLNDAANYPYTSSQGYRP